MLGRIRITETFSTAASPAAVWAALEAAPRWPQVQSDLIEARIEPDGVLAAGATIRTKAKPGTAAVDMSYRVVEAQRPNRLTIEAPAAGHFRSRTEYRIEPEGAGTRLTISAAVEPVLWLHKITTQLARGWYTRQLSENLRTRTGSLLALAGEIAAQA
jgi:carbon monoxide dehydrogenase subunit G